MDKWLPLGRHDDQDEITQGTQDNLARAKLNMTDLLRKRKISSNKSNLRSKGLFQQKLLWMDGHWWLEEAALVSSKPSRPSWKSSEARTSALDNKH